MFPSFPGSSSLDTSFSLSSRSELGGGSSRGELPLAPSGGPEVLLDLSSAAPFTDLIVSTFSMNVCFCDKLYNFINPAERHVGLAYTYKPWCCRESPVLNTSTVLTRSCQDGDSVWFLNHTFWFLPPVNLLLFLQLLGFPHFLLRLHREITLVLLLLIHIYVWRRCLQSSC